MTPVEFTSAKELYERLLPALKSKRRILSKSGYSYIKEKDIWDALRTLKWHQSNGLELCDMVDDILHTENQFFNSYYHRFDNEINIENDLPKLKDNNPGGN